MFTSFFYVHIPHVTFEPWLLGYLFKPEDDAGADGLDNGRRAALLALLDVSNVRVLFARHLDRQTLVLEIIGMNSVSLNYQEKQQQNNTMCCWGSRFVDYYRPKRHICHG